ncbi:MAG: LytTR family DNA-binding domain-containing protein [Opitutaceae bacterium]
MTNLRVFIVEDEAPARQRLRAMLAAETQLTLVGESDGGPNAAAELQAAKPDLLFLDLHLGKRDGFALLDEAGLAPAPAVVVLTAYAEHAVEAFERGATDYLLKPFRLPRLRAAVARVRESLESRSTANEERGDGAWLRRFVVRNERHLAVVPVEQVDWLAAAGNYVVLHAGRTTHVLRESLAALEARLDPSAFVRISRSAMVNLDRISSLATDDSGDSSVTLSNGERLSLTRGIRELQARLEIG